MRRHTASIAFAALLFALVAALAWPAFTGVATLAGLVRGEAWQLDAWTLEPKRHLLARFVDGWARSAPIAAGFGLVALLDLATFGRLRRAQLWARLLSGALLPAGGAGIALALWPVPMDALPTLAGTGLVLAAAYRATLALRERVL